MVRRPGISRQGGEGSGCLVLCGEQMEGQETQSDIASRGVDFPAEDQILLGDSRCCCV